MPYRPLPKPPIAGDVVGFLVMTTDADPPPARWILRAHWSEHEPRCDLYLLDAPDPRYMPADSRVGDRLVRYDMRDVVLRTQNLCFHGPASLPVSRYRLRSLYRVGGTVAICTVLPPERARKCHNLLFFVLQSFVKKYTIK